MRRFDCCEEINIVINLEMKIASVDIIHKILHELPKEIGVTRTPPTYKIGPTGLR